MTSNAPIDWLKSATEFTAAEYAEVKRFIAAGGEIPSRASAIKAKIAQEVAAMERAKTAEASAANTSVTTPTPPPTPTRDGPPDAMSMSQTEYREAKRAITSNQTPRAQINIA